MIKFTKMHGLGNDYVYLDCTKCEVPNDIASLAQFVSNRHFGVGSDGLILVCLSQKADFRMRMFNKDGSEAEMCGNGIRCVGKFVYDKGLTNQTHITVETLGGIKQLQLNVKEGKVETVKVDMGEPIFDFEKIPVCNAQISKEKIPMVKQSVLDKEFELFCVSVGNPHAVVILNQIEKFNLEKYGPLLEVDSHFPNKSNIEFIKIVDEEFIKMRVWERGTGETMACGTGATACFAICHQIGLVKQKAKVELLGGILEFEWNLENNHIEMTGPATTVFEGELQIDKEKGDKYGNN